MKRIPVQSDYLQSVGYAPCASVLEIEFAGGKVCQYLDIPTSVFDALMASPGKEAFFRERIEPHHSVRELGISSGGPS
jgi:hypothetical protein